MLQIVNPAQAYSEAAQASGAIGAKPPKPSFANVLSNHLPKAGNTISDELRAHAAEKKLMLSELAEKLRVETRTKRMELLALLMQRDDDEKPYDMLGKALDIARRIMRGERVSAEDMRFLALHFPDLLFMALLLRQEEMETDGEDDQPNGECFIDDYNCFNEIKML